MSSLSDAIASRQDRLAESLGAFGFDALVVNAGPTLTYLTGLHFHVSERPVVAVFTPEGEPHLILPSLEMGKASRAPFDLSTFDYGEDPTSWQKAFNTAFKSAGVGAGNVGVEPGSLRFLELQYIRVAASEANLESAQECIASLRKIKDAEEVALMREAVLMAESAVEATLQAIKPGMNEKDIASELVLQLIRNGSSSELPFEPIVAAGPNSADPHAVPSSRRLAHGEVLLIDWGANNEGYYSDLTRVYSFGEPSEESLRIAEITAEANAAARAVAGPGVSAGDVDRAAREVITKSGYGKYFTHRTGHGLGIEVHEEPYIRGDNEELLEPGMTFTIEPGIYLAGNVGVRVEDDMLVTDSGSESLSTIERSLTIL